MKNYLIIFLLGICCLSFAGCQNYSNKAARALEKKCLAGEGTIINISALTDYKWDRLYIFSPYTDGQHIQKIVGCDFLSSEELKKIEYGISESEVMFVFVNNGKVVEHFMFWRASGDFSIFKQYNCLNFDDEKNQGKSFAHLERGNYACFGPADAKFKIDEGLLKKIE